MDTLIAKLLRRFRPRIGWPLFSLALLAVLCPAFAAGDSKLDLPSGLFAWAGLIGLPLGLWLGRAPTDRRPPTIDGQHQFRDRALRFTLYALRFALCALLVLAIGALLVVAVGQTLPPLGLALQDIGALLGWLGAALRRQAGWDTLPEPRAWGYLAASLPRFWRALQESPNAGERGAQLIVATGGVALAWLGALTLGWALARRRSLFGWAVPCLVAIGLVAILGGGSGALLVFGMLTLLTLTIGVSFSRRQQEWERSGADYSDELRLDVLAWGAGIVLLVLTVALILPTSVSNPLADMLWRDVELPSAVKVLERNIQRPRAPPKVDIGLSTLPALQLGLSLEQPPPDEVILRIRLGAPLQPSPAPRYWRARIFNIYDGRGWTQNARIGEFPTAAPVAGAVPGTIIQEVQDMRRDRTILLALPDAFAVDVGVQAERLSDGTLFALTEQPQVERYRVASRPQELAAPPPPDQPPPDLSPYLGLPRNYPVRVGDLARAIVRDSQTTGDRALALERYLRELPYAYEVRQVPRNADAVEQFLFDMRQGYCTYYASAMAVMARTLGIPARVATGYATGTYDPASGSYLVHQNDAHAWPELYIDGRWLAFEPTPIRPLPARGASAEPQPQAAPAPAAQPSSLRGPLIWAAVLALVVLLTGLGLRWGRPHPRPALAVEVQRQLERSGARAGVPWPAGATLHEYGDMLEPRAADAADALREVVDLVERARYSGRPLRGEQEGRLRAAASRLWARLGRGSR